MIKNSLGKMGEIGQRISKSYSGSIVGGWTMQNMLNFTLTKGIWAVGWQVYTNTDTAGASCQVGIGLTSGDDTDGLAINKYYLTEGSDNSNGIGNIANIKSGPNEWIVNSDTTYYLKFKSNAGAGGINCLLFCEKKAHIL